MGCNISAFKTWLKHTCFSKNFFFHFPLYVCFEQMQHLVLNQEKTEQKIYKMTKTSEVDIFSSMNLSKVEPRLDRKETTPKK